MEHGNMLAIVGSPGSGKTTLAVKLAADIAKKKKNVIVVCSDPFVPSVPFLLPMDAAADIAPCVTMGGHLIHALRLRHIRKH